MKEHMLSISFFLFYLAWIAVFFCKLAKITDLSWTIILFPIWGPLAIGLSVLSIGAIVFTVAFIVTVISEHTRRGRV
jgi:hypothetical protein